MVTRLLCVALAVLPACTSRTAVVVHLEAEPSVSETAVGLSVSLRRADGSSEDVPLPGDAAWPRTFTVVPAGGDASRTFTVVATAGAGLAAVTVRARSGFRAGEVRHLTLRFDDACLGVMCGSTASCEAGACVTECVEPGATPSSSRRVACASSSDAGQDASEGGVLDASDASAVDAGSRDAGSSDAGLPEDVSPDDATAPDAGVDAGPPRRTAGAAIAFDFAEVATGVANACAGGHAITLPATRVITQGPDGLTLSGRADAELALGRAVAPYHPAACALLDDGAGCTPSAVPGMTIEVWVTPRRMSGAAYPGGPLHTVDFDRPGAHVEIAAPIVDFACQGTGSPQVRLAGLHVSDLGFREAVRTDACTDQNGTPIFGTRSSITVAPVHVVLVRAYSAATDAADEAIYVDGVSAPLRTEAPPSPGSPCDGVAPGHRLGSMLYGDLGPYVMRLGSFPAPATDDQAHFEGTYHLLAVYPRALTPLEVMANHAAGVNANPCAP